MRIKVSIGDTATKPNFVPPIPSAKVGPPPFPFSAGLGCEPSTKPDKVRCRYPQRGIFFAEELDARPEVMKDLLSGNIPELPKGRHMQDLLNTELCRQTPKHELASVIRFPPDVASLINRRIRLEDAGVPLGLEIQPSPLEDSRIFDIRLALYEGDAKFLEEVKNNETIDERECSYTEHNHRPVEWMVMRGILLELPTKIEVYKFLPWNIEDGYKANMIGQMIYVWVPERETINIEAFRAPKDTRDQDPASWYSSISGLAPGSYNITERKFRRNDIYTREELQLAEYAMMEVLYSSYRDLLLLEATTEWDYIRNLAHLRWEKDPDAVNKARKRSNNKVVDILGPEDAQVFAPNDDGNYDSDLDSDTFFSGHHFHHRNGLNNPYIGSDLEAEPDIPEEEQPMKSKEEDSIDDNRDGTFDISDFKNV